MQPEYLSSHHHDNGKAGEDRATSTLLTRGGIDGVPAFVLRHWRPRANPPEPVFDAWLLHVGRFSLTVRYGRYSLRGGQWRVDTGTGPGRGAVDQGDAAGASVSIFTVIDRDFHGL